MKKILLCSAALVGVDAASGVVDDGNDDDAIGVVGARRASSSSAIIASLFCSLVISLSNFFVAASYLLLNSLSFWPWLTSSWKHLSSIIVVVVVAIIINSNNSNSNSSNKML